jgi:hypothetical protein
MLAQSLSQMQRPSKQLKFSPVPPNKVDDTVFDASPHRPLDDAEDERSFLMVQDMGRSMSDERSASFSSIAQDEQEHAEEEPEEDPQEQDATPPEEQQPDDENEKWFQSMEERYGMLSDAQLSAHIQGSFFFRVLFFARFAARSLLTLDATEQIAETMSVMQSMAQFAQGYIHPYHNIDQF